MCLAHATYNNHASYAFVMIPWVQPLFALKLKLSLQFSVVHKICSFFNQQVLSFCRVCQTRHGVTVNLAAIYRI